MGDLQHVDQRDATADAGGDLHRGGHRDATADAVGELQHVDHRDATADAVGDLQHIDHRDATADAVGDLQQVTVPVRIAGQHSDTISFNTLIRQEPGVDQPEHESSELSYTSSPSTRCRSRGGQYVCASGSKSGW